MGRHSRRGPAPKKGPDKGSSGKDGTGQTAAEAARGATGRERTPAAPAPVPQAARQGMPGRRGPEYGVPGADPVSGAAGRRVPAQGGPRLPDGTPARGVPRLPEGTPAHGFPRLPDGTPARGVPRVSDGQSSGQGARRFPDGTPPRGFPRVSDGMPAQGVPRVRGGHPEQRESGGGWGELSGQEPGGHAAGLGVAPPRQRQGPPGRRSGPRQDYVDAFADDVDVVAPGGPRGPGRPRGPVPVNGPVAGAGTAAAAHPAAAHPAAAHPAAAHRSDPYGPAVTDRPHDTDADARPDDGHVPPDDHPSAAKGGKGRAFTGIAAAAVVTVLAVVVAGQVTDTRDTAAGSQSATDQARDARGPATGAAGQPSPSSSVVVAPLTYEQKMDTKYPLSAKLDGSGKFDAVPGFDKAPGKGQKYTYRVDVEQGLGLDGELFAQAVQKTLNDDRSWAHNGARTFERIYSGKPDFVITLASPGTTADWCAKSGLDTTEDNVSCDSAATERVMINAYRWAQGSTTYGDRIHAYRQMLINHEVGHRLGYSHVTCDKNGELAPVMQQQTKFLDHDGIHCRANPWAYPGS
ncbi:DUF3152 domain-containing protein [Streptomyces sviceus]|uniref:DUF3152 domain-containing protein n=2 Tax=Streptomyces TaxID=1883 RepID=B5I882_STRX2|nr:conserved hypothetical protein [Streptomyces sviceus ATCC 29083]